MIFDPRRSKQLQTLVQKLGLPATAPVNWSLLDLALTHPSISKERNYQQLEFVGDAVVRLAAAEVLLETYPDAAVGEFAAVRSIMVSDRTLAEFAESYGLERYLSISSSAAADKAGRVSRLADAFEAVLGALYLSTQTMALVRPWLDDLLKEKAAEIRQDPARQNYKDALQEWTQAQYKVLPQYRVREIQPANGDRERFTAEVWLNDRKLGVGTGRSKKAAEQAAAKEAFLSVIRS
ncbi:ribonuclease III [Hydrococcus rivularis NIES-593]|uniref:Ribonuclease 3 n=1 Tax=Hydrococcus rivularis NIES-593 TaxID=1921803 RepID=A0A1U7HBW0_9CYAN|nr:ribonuclease III [Hydrococcus rivularis]OKH21077.1 ribonuclease III [Hydrococcus rivularis NIES-593]